MASRLRIRVESWIIKHTIVGRRLLNRIDELELEREIQKQYAAQARAANTASLTIPTNTFGQMTVGGLSSVVNQGISVSGQVLGSQTRPAHAPPSFTGPYSADKDAWVLVEQAEPQAWVCPNKPCSHINHVRDGYCEKCGTWDEKRVREVG